MAGTVVCIFLYVLIYPQYYPYVSIFIVTLQSLSYSVLRIQGLQNYFPCCQRDKGHNNDDILKCAKNHCRSHGVRTLLTIPTAIVVLLRSRRREQQ